MHAVDRLGNKEVSLEFERINKALVEAQQVSTEVSMMIHDVRLRLHYHCFE